MLQSQGVFDGVAQAASLSSCSPHVHVTNCCSQSVLSHFEDAYVNDGVACGIA